MARLQRRPSLLFDNYENAVITGEVAANKGRDLDNGRLKIAVDPQKISLDDLDMISLSTSFDQQMLLGSPMYLDATDNVERPSMMQEEFHKHGSHCSKPVPSDASNLHLEDLCDDQNPFEQIAELRTKYIVASSQDAKTNVKYDIDKWFLYPKPLPKFWKFSHDKRLQSSESIDGDDDDDSSREHAKKGYYFPTIGDDRYLPEDYFEPPKRLGKVHYTGEFFELEHYIEEFQSHMRNVRSRLHCEEISALPSFDDFREDFQYIITTLQRPTLSEIADRRTNYLLDKFELFQLLNSKAEILENKRVPLRDFYNARKVDRDLLFNGFITQRQLSEFIWDKINVEPNRVVYKSLDGEEYTLKQIFEKTCYQTEQLDIGLKIINDEFLEWYREIYLIKTHLIPNKDAGKALKGKELRFFLLARTFLEIDNYIDGEYMAELFIKYCVHTLESSKYQLAQISVDFQFYERDDISWWTRFANWIMKWRIISHNIRWNVQISRSYSKLHACGRVTNFQDFLNLIFEPLLRDENTMNIELQFFLSNLCCIDLVVSQFDDYLWKEFCGIDTKPADWSSGDNPTISHYMYYMYSALGKLNNIRRSKNLNSISLRNYCSPLTDRTSQAGTTSNFSDQVESLVCNLLLCEAGIVQAEPLWESPPMIRYLFYLYQIPIIVAPLSSVSTTVTQKHQNEISTILGHELQKSTRDITETDQSTYVKNPFMDLFKAGLKVSLSSNSVLFNSSYTSEPIIEEYSVAASIYLLNAADLCEFSRTSVLCSGFEGFYKAHWIGVQTSRSPFFQEEVGYVDMWYDKEADTSERHNVPLIRRRYRKETLQQEWDFVREQFQLN